MLQHQLCGSIQIIDDCSFKVSDFDMLPGSDVHWWGAAAPDFTNLTDRLVEKGDTQLAAVLREIQPLLEDAQRRQLKDVFVRKWLCDFTDAVYDLEELLDEWDTALLKIKIKKLQFGISEKVRFCILNSFICFCQVRRVGQRRQIAVELNQLRERLSAVESERGKYGFNSLNKLNNVGEIEQIEQPARLGTTSLIEESAIYGRDEDKKVLMSRLVSESSEDGIRRNVDVIPIVGMGGMERPLLLNWCITTTGSEPILICEFGCALPNPFLRHRLHLAPLGISLICSMPTRGRFT
ncbi:hypothetical protein ACFX10_008390 [Malus domestica]